MADYSTEIAQLEAILNGATESVTIDGTSTKLSLSEARKRLAELKLLDPDSTGLKRPPVFSMKLPGLW